MKRLFCSIILAWMIAYLVGAPSLQAKTYVYFEHVTCANGFEDAYVITEIDGLFGCVLGCYGVDCSGAHFSYAAPKRPIVADAEEPYDLMYSGTIEGRPWYAKVSLAAGGTVGKVWGQQTDGTFYEIVPQ